MIKKLKGVANNLWDNIGQTELFSVASGYGKQADRPNSSYCKYQNGYQETKEYILVNQSVYSLETWLFVRDQEVALQLKTLQILDSKRHQIMHSRRIEYQSGNFED